MKTLAALALSFSLLTTPDGETSFSLANGRLKFSAPSDWEVIARKLDGMKTTVAFQIKNPADEGTEDSTNLAVLAYDILLEKTKAEFDDLTDRLATSGHKRETWEGWACYGFSDVQGSTKYEIRDCIGKTPHFGIRVRLAWPLLKDNPKNYAQMLTDALHGVLKSIAETGS